LAILLARLEQQFDIDPDHVDQVLGGAIELTPHQVALYAVISGGRP
jgi:hypothetical protein